MKSFEWYNSKESKERGKWRKELKEIKGIVR